MVFQRAGQGENPSFHRRFQPLAVGDVVGKAAGNSFLSEFQVVDSHFDREGGAVFAAVILFGRDGSLVLDLLESLRPAFCGHLDVHVADMHAEKLFCE